MCSDAAKNFLNDPTAPEFDETRSGFPPIWSYEGRAGHTIGIWSYPTQGRKTEIMRMLNLFLIWGFLSDFEAEIREDMATISPPKQSNLPLIGCSQIAPIDRYDFALLLNVLACFAVGSRWFSNNYEA